MDSCSFFSNPDAEYRSVLRFLDLPERSLPSYEKMNAHSYDRMSRGLSPSFAIASRRRTGHSPSTWGARSTGERDRADVGGSDTTSDHPEVNRPRRHSPTCDRGPWGVLNLVGVVSNTVFNFVLVLIVTRGLGITTTGIFFEAIALFNILATASQWGADVGVVRAIPRYRVLGRSQTCATASAPRSLRRSFSGPPLPEACSSSPGHWDGCSRAAPLQARSHPAFG